MDRTQKARGAVAAFERVEELGPRDLDSRRDCVGFTLAEGASGVLVVVHDELGHAVAELWMGEEAERGVRIGYGTRQGVVQFEELQATCLRVARVASDDMLPHTRGIAMDGGCSGPRLPEFSMEEAHAWRRCVSETELELLGLVLRAYGRARSRALLKDSRGSMREVLCISGSYSKPKVRVETRSCEAPQDSPHRSSLEVRFELGNSLRGTWQLSFPQLTFASASSVMHRRVLLLRSEDETDAEALCFARGLDFGRAVRAFAERWDRARARGEELPARLEIASTGIHACLVDAFRDTEVEVAESVADESWAAAAMGCHRRAQLGELRDRELLPPAENLVAWKALLHDVKRRIVDERGQRTHPVRESWIHYFDEPMPDLVALQEGAGALKAIALQEWEMLRWREQSEQPTCAESVAREAMTPGERSLVEGLIESVPSLYRVEATHDDGRLELLDLLREREAKAFEPLLARARLRGMIFPLRLFDTFGPGLCSVVGPGFRSEQLPSALSLLAEEAGIEVGVLPKPENEKVFGALWRLYQVD